MPQEFKSNWKEDCANYDLLIIMGTSLKVAPVNKIPRMVGPKVPRIFINLEPVDQFIYEEPSCNYRYMYSRKM